LIHEKDIEDIRYGRGKISRVSQVSPSAENQELGEANLPRVLHLRKRGFLSAAAYLTLGKERHSAKALFPECNTWRRATLGKEKCYLTAQSTGVVTTKNEKNLLWVPCLALGEEALSWVPWHGPRGKGRLFWVLCPRTECSVLALGEGSLPQERQGRHSGIFFLFFGFLPYFFWDLLTLFKTLCSNLENFKTPCSHFFKLGLERLPYFDDLRLPRNIDVIYTEKNITEALWTHTHGHSWQDKGQP